MKVLIHLVLKNKNFSSPDILFSNEYGGIYYLVFIGTDGHKYLVNEKHVSSQSTGMRTNEKVLNEWVEKEILFYSKGITCPTPTSPTAICMTVSCS